MENVLVDMLGEGTIPEFVSAAEVGKLSSKLEDCQDVFARCPLSSQEVASKVLS